jgi:hypothetical protein
LGGKSGTEDIFYEQLRQEGQAVAGSNTSVSLFLCDFLRIILQANPLSSAEPITETNIHREAVHLKSVEKITAVVKRDGVLENGEVSGSIILNVNDGQFNTVAIQVKNNDTSGAHLQVHPNLDKKTWQVESALRLKSAQKPFPVNVDVGILKWRLQLKDEGSLPLALNVWPNESPSGCTVNIEYTLQSNHLTLNNVKITIPLP